MQGREWLRAFSLPGTTAMAVRAQPEPHIEVHKFHAGAVAGAAFVALVLQAFLPIYFAKAELLELPLLVTLYFGLSRRNPASGLLLGTLIGLLQDSLSAKPIGLYGIAKTFVGFGASSIGARLNVEHPLSRFTLAFLFFHFHQAVFALTKRLLLAEPEPVLTLKWLLAALINAALAVLLFPLLDRLRRPS
jgi:rod shape-determining protein MreD